MTTKKELLRTFLNLIEANDDYKAEKSIISRKDYLPQLIKMGRVDKEYLAYAVQSLLDTAHVALSDHQKVWTALYNSKGATIKRIVALAHKYQH